MNSAPVQAVFARETAGIELFEKLMPLLIPYFREVASHQDIELKPDFAQYKILEDAGVLRIYTARISDEVVGFSAMFVSNHLHVANSKQAIQDLLYISPAYRGFGVSFIRWCDEQLVTEGVDVIYRSMHTLRDFIPTMTRIGYELIEQTFARRL